MAKKGTKTKEATDRIASRERKWGYIKLQIVDYVGQPCGCRRQLNERGENVKQYLEHSLSGMGLYSF